MRVVVIGGGGHIGTFLVPRLVRAGHQVVVLTRGGAPRYAGGPEWDQVQQVTADREQEDRDGVFGDRVVGLAPDVVIDLVCFTLDSATALVERLRGEAGRLLHCGSTWRFGPSRKVPIAEDGAATGPPFGEYGIQKARIARMLKEETAAGGLATVSLHPGHIVGPGWSPIGPLGNLDPRVWLALSAGRPVQVPGDGTQLLHHVHADDVAQAFELAVGSSAAVGEDINVVAPTALGVRGYLEVAAGWFGQEAGIEPVSWERFRSGTAQEHADASWDHLHRSQCFSIDKARRLLGFSPRYEPDEAILESLRWLIEHDRLEVARALS